MIVVSTANSAKAENKPEKQLSDESKFCLNCHGKARYFLHDTVSGDSVKMHMYVELRIDQTKYQNATHGGFKCTDCHSADYSILPHPVSAKIEAKYTCLDCHGGDEQYAAYHFELIDEEFQKSVHAQKLGSDFDCWSCHNPHTYRVTGDKEKVDNKVAMNNAMCLNCHGNPINYESLVDKQTPDLINRHEWLPNQALHFKNVRCIDCHGAQNDSLNVAHMIKPRSEAVKRCVECHSTNSILMASLYKHAVSEKRSTYGFYNGVVMNDAYIIGANRNFYLNAFSLIMFAVALLGIAIHSYLRFKKQRNHGNK